MDIIRVPRIVQDLCSTERMRGRQVGLVPTMGALHEGHLHLVRRAREENDFVVASIFVNPTQFGPSEDFTQYPRDLDGDRAKLAAEGVDAVFVPDEKTVYPEGFSTTVSAGELSTKLCGSFRPGHFDAVATVVLKLLNIAGPTRAYFGQKDYQQTVVIRRVVRDLNVPVEIIVCPTVREEDGLAMSSRNAYLDDKRRKAAAEIYRTLAASEERINSGVRDVSEIRSLMHKSLSSEPLIKEIQYASAYNPETLDEPSEVKGDTLLAIAVVMDGGTRLIDNVLVQA